MSLSFGWRKLFVLSQRLLNTTFGAGRWGAGTGVLGSKFDGRCTVFSNAYFCMSSNLVVCLCNVVVVVVVVFVVVVVMWHVVNVKS